MAIFQITNRKLLKWFAVLSIITNRKLWKWFAVLSILSIIFMVWNLHVRNKAKGYFPQRPLDIRPPPVETYLITYENNYWRPEKIKKILIYTPFFYVWDWADSVKKSVKECKNITSECEVTRNRSEIAESSAIVFHATDYWKLYNSEMPKYRHPRQVWVMFTMEANPYMTGALPNHTFNWTMSYRRDATIVTPYGGPYVKKTEEELNGGDQDFAIDYFSEKTKFAVIQVSNCRDTARRYRIIHELSKYIELEQFGKCPGNVICKVGEVTFEECTNRLKHYKFYLAFENSYCRDYITEKYWQSQLDRHQIPVVAYSKATTELLPPHSYINIFDFPNLKAVADKMIEIGSNKTLYNTYFEWQNYYKSVGRNPYCEMCEFLHANRTAQSYDLEAWMKHDSCSLPTVSYYRKILKIRTPEKFIVITLKFERGGFIAE